MNEHQLPIRDIANAKKTNTQTDFETTIYFDFQSDNWRSLGVFLLLSPGFASSTGGYSNNTLLGF